MFTHYKDQKSVGHYFVWSQRTDEWAINSHRMALVDILIARIVGEHKSIYMNQTNPKSYIQKSLECRAEYYENHFAAWHVLWIVKICKQLWLSIIKRNTVIPEQQKKILFDLFRKFDANDIYLECQKN